MVYYDFELSDFHTHSFASDGVLSRIELIRRAAVLEYKNICIADHCGEGDLEQVISACIKDCELASDNWSVRALPGIELTHVPPKQICRLARKAKSLGAAIVVVHGETPVEPVALGTNTHAVNCEYVDILSHPGLISGRDLEDAKNNNTFIELTTRTGHCLTNGYVAAKASQIGARMLINSDAHSPADLLTKESAVNALTGAGLAETEIIRILTENVKLLLKRA